MPGGGGGAGGAGGLQCGNEEAGGRIIQGPCRRGGGQASQAGRRRKAGPTRAGGVVLAYSRGRRPRWGRRLGRLGRRLGRRLGAGRRWRAWGREGRVGRAGGRGGVVLLGGRGDEPAGRRQGWRARGVSRQAGRLKGTAQAARRHASRVPGAGFTHGQARGKRTPLHKHSRPQPAPAHAPAAPAAADRATHPPLAGLGWIDGGVGGVGKEQDAGGACGGRAGRHRRRVRVGKAVGKARGHSRSI